MPLQTIGALPDASKTGGVEKTISLGLKNYLLFQSYHHYRWPLWLISSIDELERHFRPVTPPILLNTYYRDWMYFTSILSSHRIMIDHAGMLTPTNAPWSIELWVLNGNRVFRPQDDCNSIIQVRDPHTSLITTKWTNRDFTLHMEMYGTRTSIDEAIADISFSTVGKAGGTSLVVAVRPYGTEQIGGLHSLEYQSENKTVRINNETTFYVSHSPSEVFTGSGMYGDVNFREKQGKVSCFDGMASMALVYPVKKELLELKVRLSLSEKKSVESLKLNYISVKKDFAEYLDVMKRQGFILSIGDKRLSNWFVNTKLISLGNVNRMIRLLGDKCGVIEARESFYLVKALSRMGFDKEARLIVDAWRTSIHISERTEFDDLIIFCYFLSSFADSYLFTRDTAYLQDNYEFIKKLAHAALSAGKDLFQKKKKKAAHNSLPYVYAGRYHLHDTLLYAHTLSQYAYLCRTIGLFGDEIKFSREAERYHEMLSYEITGLIASAAAESPLDSDAFSGIHGLDEFIVYLSFCVSPFAVDSIKREEKKKLLSMISAVYKKKPLFLRSFGGWDIFLTIMFARNTLLMNDAASQDIIEFFLNIGEPRYSLPDCIHPVSLRGIGGTGESSMVNSSIFLFLRNLILIDGPNRLEIFPVPKEEWFRPGAEIVVENAPSRFGKIHFKVISTQNEIQMYFTELPKYVPPDIMIHLPYKTELKEGDDFMLKKEEGFSYIINGWPSVIRFVRTGQEKNS